MGSSCYAVSPKSPLDPTSVPFASLLKSSKRFWVVAALIGFRNPPTKASSREPSGKMMPDNNHDYYPCDCCC